MSHMSSNIIQQDVSNKTETQPIQFQHSCINTTIIFDMQNCSFTNSVLFPSFFSVFFSRLLLHYFSYITYSENAVKTKNNFSCSLKQNLGKNFTNHASRNVIFCMLIFTSLFQFSVLPFIQLLQNFLTCF
jgi:hypothetical protein